MRGRGRRGGVEACEVDVNFVSDGVCSNEWCRPVNIDINIPDLSYYSSKVVPHPCMEGADFEKVLSVSVGEIGLVA